MKSVWMMGFGAIALVACEVAEHSEKIQTYEVVGTVESVRAARHQVVIDHGDIAGLMPAMTMSYDVPNPAVLSKMREGQEVEFTLEVRDRSFRIVDVEVLSDNGSAGRSGTFSDDRPAQVAPAFTLIDQEGASVSLADLSGKWVLLDFIYTLCPGPCPILTGIHVDVQKQLPAELRERVHFVSISLDPTRDTPEAMKAYALARGADLSRWSFLTGEARAIQDVLSDYGVGSGVQPNGEIEHLVITFLIDGDGRIQKRYLGLEHSPDSIVSDLERKT